MRPFDNITRAEAVIMLARAFSIAEYADGIRIYDDAADIPDWAAGFVGAMAYADYLPFEDTFQYDQDITRAEIVLILDRLLTEVIQNSGVYTDNIHGNVLVTAPDVVFSDLTVTGNVYVTGQAEGFTLSGADGGLEKSII